MEKQHSYLDFQDYRPSEFMRARRPELFSDSRIIKEYILSKEVFEYHLSTLTNRKQEYDFEHFCRRLAEKEICPNLLPQTGPTGGGDSKVDSENYPVAEEISIRWYHGIAHEANQEKWGFAFSAMEDWLAKIRSDIKKIVDTNRGYSLVYFITNQYVKDKKRAEIEDELSKIYNTNIRILDRSWILKVVFEHNLISIAIDSLNLTDFQDSERIKIGPRDTEKKRLLEELDKQINDTNRYTGIEYQLAEDCLQTALLARGLGLPRSDVDGRFDRAERIAKRLDYPQQLLRIYYQRAWTSYWWYDDLSTLNELYDNVEKYVCDSVQATDIEMLVNLWIILKPNIVRGTIKSEEVKFEDRTKKLKDELGRLIADKSRPNNSSLAHTDLLNIEIIESIGSPEKLSHALSELRSVISNIDGMIDYPFDMVLKIISELGNILVENAEYDILFEELVKIAEKRTSEGSTGQLLLQRGFQKLSKGKTYDAIRLFGLAQQKLIKYEYREKLVVSLIGCGMAYEQAGLLWAARSSLLAALNQSVAEFVKYGEFVDITLPCLQKLIWIEMQIGRLPYIFSWIELSKMIAGHLMLNKKEEGKYLEERQNQDIVLGILLLKTDFWDLKNLDFIPDLLNRMDLMNSRLALLYALGYEDSLRKEGSIPESDTKENVLDLFTKMTKQPANDDLPCKPELMLQSNILFKSNILGCDVVVEVDNNQESIFLAETILGTMEAFVATSLDYKIMPFKSEISIRIKPSVFNSELPEIDLSSFNCDSCLVITHPLSLNNLFLKDQEKFRMWLLDVVAKILANSTVINDSHSYFENLAKNEHAFERALNFSDIRTTIHNILGQSPKFRLSDWDDTKTIKRFSVNRNEPLFDNINEINKTNTRKHTQPKLGKGEPPQELFDTNKMKHKDRKILSLINIPLWDKAGWKATAYMHSHDSSLPPVLVIGFTNIEAGRSIFQEWQNLLGKVDVNDQIHVSIITGIDRSNPYSYRVVINSNLTNQFNESLNKQFLIVSRINRMDPHDSKNLDTFIREYDKFKSYYFVPAFLEDITKQPKFFMDLGIKKSEIRITPAWKMQENDPDLVAIEENDDIIIPSGVENLPFFNTIRHLKEQKIK